MLAYRLRHRVTFETKTAPVRDADGYPIPGSGSWQVVVLADGSPLANVPAEVLTGPGREFQGGASTQSEISARINLRWFPASEHDMMAWRVLWDGRIYNIQSVATDVTTRRVWRLRCANGPGEGQ